jgi:hypothetical protein
LFVATPSNSTTVDVDPGAADPLYMPSDGTEPIDYRLRWTASTKQLVGNVGSLEACVDGTATESTPAFGSTAVTFTSVAGTPDRGEETLRYNCGGIGAIEGWIVARGSWAFDLETGLEADEKGSNDGVIYM